MLSDGFFETLVEIAPDALVVYDDRSTITYVNQQTEQLFGYARGELLGAPVETLVPARFRSSQLAAHTDTHSAANSGVPKNTDDTQGMCAVRKDGSEFPVEISLSPMDTPQGCCTIAAIRAQREPAARSRATAATVDKLKTDFLANMSHELRSPLNAIIGFAKLMYNGRVGAVSEAHREYLGDILTSAEHLLHVINDVVDLSKVEAGRMDFYPEPVSLQQLLQEVHASLLSIASTKQISFDFSVDPACEGAELDPDKLRQVLYNLLSNALKFTADGGSIELRAALDDEVHEWTRGAGLSARHFRDALWPVRDAAGQVQSVVRVARDVTDEKRRQAYAMVSNRMASVGMLAAGIGHEINNPLMAVLGNLQLVLDGRLHREASDDEAQSLTDAFDAAKRVEAIVRDLRLFSRSDADHRTHVDVHSLLDSTVRMARAALRHRARIVKNYRQAPSVLACESRLGQVFLNLIINAAQALPENGENSEEIRISTGLDAQGRVCIEISDTGCGIPEDVARRLFTPFLTTKPVGVGTGLGLVICQRIVSSLDGEIAFESQVGTGTTFRVLLPAAAKPNSIARPAEPAQPPLSQRGRVVIIDDEALVGTMLSKTLGRDHTTYHFSDARAALLHLRSEPDVDVILCDLIMPDMSGMEFYEALVQTLPTLSARVVFLTGGAFTQTMLEFLERVPNLHLRKPLNIGELRGLVNERVNARIAC